MAEASAASPLPPAPASQGGAEPDSLVAEVANLELKHESDVGQAKPEAVLPPHRSHDPQYNQKRSDPFQFGSRFLSENDDVFEFNAWDHVETDDAYKEYSEQQYEMQRQSPVSDFDKGRFNNNPEKWWNLFYKNNTANFFKNRKWLRQEFPILDKATAADGGPMTLLEIGAGAGNTAFPILEASQNPKLKIHACDFSKTAVDVMRSHEKYDDAAAAEVHGTIQADVWDAASDELPPGLEEGSVDVALMIFIFSALAPNQWQKAVRNVHRLLRPGGLVCFRDYGRGDLAQVRFRKGRYMSENFYVRGDGTRVYFFDKDELARIWSGEDTAGPADDSQEAAASEDRSPAHVQAEADAQKETGQSSQREGLVPLFEVEDLGVDRRMLVNRAKQLKMYRCWIQGKFRKR